MPIKKDLSIDLSGDMVIKDGDWALKTGNEVTVQNLNLALSIVQGELVYDTSIGVPYLDERFADNPEEEFIIGAIFATVTQLPNIDRVLDITLNTSELNKGKLTYNVDVVLTDLEAPTTLTVAVPLG